MPYSKAHKSRSKERILKSASELFARYGFDRVSIGQIMKLARMTHGAFYAHFESKQALFKAYLANAFQRNWRGRLAKEPFSIRHLTSLVTDYLNLGALKDRVEPGPESVLFNEIGSDKAEIRQLYEQAYERMKAMLERRIIALSRLKKLPFQPDPAVVTDKSHSILATMVGAVVIAKSISTEQQQQRILEAAQGQILSILGLSHDAAALNADFVRE